MEHVLVDGECVSCSRSQPVEMAAAAHLHVLDNGICTTCDGEDLLDEDSAALLQALNEMDRPLGKAQRAAWDPAKHVRNPKGPGGGRFRSNVDKLKDAIAAHKAGTHDGHPFDGFDREQLRKVAKARGIELKRGESRESISAKLLDHLDSKGAEPKAKDYKTHDFYDGLHVNGKRMEENLRGPVPKTTLDDKAARAAKEWTDGYLAERWAKDLRGGYAEGTLLNRRGEQFDLAELTRDMDRAVSQGKIQHDTELWRGITLTDEEADRLFKPGKAFSDRSYSATSFRRSAAEQMLNYRLQNGGSERKPYLMRLLTPAGTHAAPGADPVAEAVLGRGVRQRVVSVEPGVGRAPGIITVEVLG